MRSWAAVWARSGLRGQGKARAAVIARRWRRTRATVGCSCGFPKNERSNIDKYEAEALKKLAVHLLSLTALEIGKAERAGESMEVNCDAKD